MTQSTSQISLKLISNSEKEGKPSLLGDVGKLIRRVTGKAWWPFYFTRSLQFSAAVLPAHHSPGSTSKWMFNWVQKLRSQETKLWNGLTVSYSGLNNLQPILEIALPLISVGMHLVPAFPSLPHVVHIHTCSCKCWWPLPSALLVSTDQNSLTHARIKSLFPGDSPGSPVV